MTSIKPKEQAEEVANDDGSCQIDTMSKPSQPAAPAQKKEEPKAEALASEKDDLSTQFKHIAFDSHLVEMRKKCAKLHASH